MNTDPLDFKTMEQSIIQIVHSSEYLRQHFHEIGGGSTTAFTVEDYFAASPKGGACLAFNLSRCAKRAAKEGWEPQRKALEELHQKWLLGFRRDPHPLSTHRTAAARP